MRHLEALIDGFRHKRILVVGDVMLDRYVWGRADRLSPEAPVPVVKVERETELPGGAANVAVNVAALQAKVVMVGVVGADRQGETLVALMAERGIECECVADPRRPTVSKTRVMAQHHQIARLDYEHPASVDAAVEAALIERYERCLHNAQAVVVSDYAKGVLTRPFLARTIESGRRAGVPVLADPKGVDFGRYSGATVVTPNAREALAAAGYASSSPEQVEEAGRTLAGTLGGSAVLITCGEHGMIVIEPGRAAEHVSSAARHVYDVTGAGDTVIAVLALCLASGEPLLPAARLANYAAGLVVGKLGAASVSPSELQTYAADPESAAETVQSS